MVKVAFPLLLRETMPRVVPPFMNTTPPVGVPPEEVTVAVKVTESAAFAGFFDEASVVVVLAPEVGGGATLITSGTMADVLELNPVAPS